MNHVNGPAVSAASKKLNSWFPLGFKMGVNEEGGVVISEELSGDPRADDGVKSVSTKLEFSTIDEAVVDADTDTDAAESQNDQKIAPETNGEVKKEVKKEVEKEAEEESKKVENGVGNGKAHV